MIYCNRIQDVIKKALKMKHNISCDVIRIFEPAGKSGQRVQLTSDKMPLYKKFNKNASQHKFNNFVEFKIEQS